MTDGSPDARSDVTLFLHATQVVTCATPDESCVRSGTALAVQDGIILDLDGAASLRARHPAARIVNCADRVITPGFIDSHTHAVFGGWRADEYALRCRGVSYAEIARQGGGILASVRGVRARTEEELMACARPRLEAMLRSGTTTAEVKSGYGLDTNTELKQLRVVQRLDRELPLDLIATFMGAHDIPLEYRDRPDAYVDVVVREMIPAVAAQGIARFCDVFMEPGAFAGSQARRVLEAGRAHGLIPRLHADEFEWSGGAELAAALDAASADHLGAISDGGIAALAASRTVATLLPATLVFLGRTSLAPARRLLDAGAQVALASDFNPGSSPTGNMPLVLTLACSLMAMHPLEAIRAATAGGAAALRLADGRGTLGPRAPADLIVWDVADYREIPYRFGSPPEPAVWKAGRLVV